MKLAVFILLFGWALSTVASPLLGSANEATRESTDVNENTHSNQQIRDKDTWGFYGQVGNFTCCGISTFGISGGLSYYLNRDNVLSLELGAGTNWDFWDSISGNTVNSSDYRLGLYHRYFAGNTLYFKWGVEGTQVWYNVTHYPILGGSSYSQTANLMVLSAAFGVGNQWQIGKLTFGVDWVSLFLPFTNIGFNETDSGPMGGTWWDLKSRLYAPQLMLGRVSIGTAF